MKEDSSCSEIDVPGHASAFTAYPEIGSKLASDAAYAVKRIPDL
jgi:hypothetical protein